MKIDMLVGFYSEMETIKVAVTTGKKEFKLNIKIIVIKRS
jgi:hypothetical protein